MSFVATGLALLALGSPVPAFKHAVVIVFENKERGEVAASAEAPTFARLAHAGATLTHYYGVTHPSLPNYLALVSGSTQGIQSDCTDCTAAGTSLATTLAVAHRTWKAYVEGLPYPGFRRAGAGRYAKRHEPFAYFSKVDESRIVPFGRLQRDLAAGRLPDFSLIVPDLCDDMHDCSIEVGDRWLARMIEPLLRLRRTAVFVVFDEGRTDAGGGGHVAAFVVGTAVRPGSTFATRTSHYGVLRTIEDAWRLPRLGLSATAAPIVGVWR